MDEWFDDWFHFRSQTLIWFINDQSDFFLHDWFGFRLVLDFGEILPKHDAFSTSFGPNMWQVHFSEFIWQKLLEASRNCHLNQQNVFLRWDIFLLKSNCYCQSRLFTRNLLFFLGLEYGFWYERKKLIVKMVWVDEMVNISFFICFPH